MKFKGFSDKSLEGLEKQLNDYFAQLAPKTIDVKYAIVHEAIAVDTETGVYPSVLYTALVTMS